MLFLFKIELASEAEARKVLYAIYDLRKNETVPDQEEINSDYYNLFYQNNLIINFFIFQ